MVVEAAEYVGIIISVLYGIRELFYFGRKAFGCPREGCSPRFYRCWMVRPWCTLSKALVCVSISVETITLN